MMRRRISVRIACVFTILAIAGTLAACGKYGSPKRPTAKPAEAGLAIPIAASLAKR